MKRRAWLIHGVSWMAAILVFVLLAALSAEAREFEAAVNVLSQDTGEPDKWDIVGSDQLQELKTNHSCVRSQMATLATSLRSPEVQTIADQAGANDIGITVNLYYGVDSEADTLKPHRVAISWEIRSEANHPEVGRNVTQAEFRQSEGGYSGQIFTLVNEEPGEKSVYLTDDTDKHKVRLPNGEICRIVPAMLTRPLEVGLENSRQGIFFSDRELSMSSKLSAFQSPWWLLLPVAPGSSNSNGGPEGVVDKPAISDVQRTFNMRYRHGGDEVFAVTEEMKRAILQSELRGVGASKSLVVVEPQEDKKP